MLQETQKYEYLERMIAKRGIRKTIIARVVGISPKTLTNKVNGKAAFTWPEVQAIQSQFFPDILPNLGISRPKALARRPISGFSR